MACELEAAWFPFARQNKKRRIGIRRSQERNGPVYRPWLIRRQLQAFAFFALYQSALIAAYPDHFSGRSSMAKIAVTGHTGTQAPQSIHSSGLMYSCFSPSKSASSLRG